ncbi:MAG: hypothetical protein WAW06_02955 [bacterium]
MRNILGKPPTTDLLAIVVAVICVYLSGCAPSVCPGHKTFTQANIDMLRVGMTSDEVWAILGGPDEQYDDNFGANVGEEWAGRVWLYFNERDERLRLVTRCKKSVFVFYEARGQLRLNHWAIEK